MTRFPNQRPSKRDPESYADYVAARRFNAFAIVAISLVVTGVCVLAFKLVQL